MQQKTVKEPDHKRFGFEKKVLTATIVATLVGLGITTAAHAVSEPAKVPTTDTQEKVNFFSKIGPYDVAAAESSPTITVETVTIAPPPPPVPPAGSLLLAAARAQLGTWQDCTALVEKSLRTLGYSVGDLGPMGFGSFGTIVAAADAQPGDIMMRWGHVAIYAGDGIAVQGGYNGTTVEVGGGDSSPYNYALVIRLP